jgi:hypothetical protein
MPMSRLIRRSLFHGAKPSRRSPDLCPIDFPAEGLSNGQTVASEFAYRRNTSNELAQFPPRNYIQRSQGPTSVEHPMLQGIVRRQFAPSVRIPGVPGA